MLVLSGNSDCFVPKLLQRLGLEDRTEYYPAQLSGGQQQRVSIARALMNGGQVILADEPTGALDSHSGEEVMAILHQLRDRGHTVIIVTHDPAGRCSGRAGDRNSRRRNRANSRH